jgi:hypothetical protein
MNLPGPIATRRTHVLAILLLTGLLPAAAVAQRPQLALPAELLCQGRVEPLAVAEAHPLLAWKLAPAAAGLHGLRMSGYQIQVAATAAEIAAGRQLVWDSGKTATELNAVPAAAYQGPALEAGHRYWWRVRVWDGNGKPSPWSEPAQFAAAPQWQAQWIAAAASDAEAGRRPMPLFRKQFQLDAPVRRAVLHIAGLGQYEAHINGAKVGNQELTPGWSDYRKTVFYDSFDVTHMLHAGANAMGVLLGNGMFRVQHTAGRYTKLEGSYGPPELTAQLHIELANGKTVEVASDGSWKTAEGPIVFSSPYGGEDYDARRELTGWDAAGFADAAWNAAMVVAGPGGALRPELAAAIAVQRRYPPTKQHEIKPGVTVYDLGQNFAGWPTIAVSGPAGSAVKLVGGELLNADGTVSQKSTGKPQWFTYTLKGAELERWHPRFSYWGFRYVQVETTGGARVVSLAGEAVHSSSARTGAFESSSELLNRIHTLILRSVENNAESLLTDCPHREKLGWLEETHLLAPSILYDFDFRGIYTALAQNLADGQKTNGAIPEIVPQYVVFNDKWGPFNDSPEWGSAAVLAPWYVFQRMGDRELLLAQREVMRRYVDYLGTRAEGGIVRYGLGDWYDIGPGAPGISKLTTPGVTATAIYYQDLTVLAQVEAMAGDEAANRHYADLAASVRAAFNAAFFDREHHRYDKGSQTAQAMPLELGMEPEGEHDAVLQALVDDIHAHSDHVTAGDIGYHYVVDALLANGRSDVLLQMLERTDTPSYGYQLAQGATALTEAWDANPSSSQDHFMLGDAEEWFFSGLGGIRIDHAAEREEQLLIAPAVVGDVQWVDAHYDSTWGRIGSSWRKAAGTVTYALTIPVNTLATVRIATAEPARVTVNGARTATAAGVLKTGVTAGTIELVMGSGSYRVVAAAPQTTILNSQEEEKQEKP